MVIFDTMMSMISSDTDKFVKHPFNGFHCILLLQNGHLDVDV